MGAPQIATLSERIAERRGTNVVRLHPGEPEPMSPFMRRLRAKQLDAKVLSNGSYVPSGSDGAA